MNKEQIDKAKQTIERNIEILQEELKKLEKQKESLVDPFIRLATVIHSKTCHYSHEDQCGWEYEDKSAFYRKGSSRNSYYERARNIMTKLNDIDVETVIRVITNF